MIRCSFVIDLSYMLKKPIPNCSFVQLGIVIYHFVIITFLILIFRSEHDNPEGYVFEDIKANFYADQPVA